MGKDKFLVLSDIYSRDKGDPEVLYTKGDIVTPLYYFEDENYYLFPTNVFTPHFQGHVLNKKLIELIEDGKSS